MIYKVCDEDVLVSLALGNDGFGDFGVRRSSQQEDDFEVVGDLILVGSPTGADSAADLEVFGGGVRYD